jgi:hypothetical protein
LYKSDDMLFNGDFVDIGSIDSLLELDFTIQLYLYHRLSDHDVRIHHSHRKKLSQSSTFLDHYS